MPQTNPSPPRTRSSRGQPVAIPRFALYGEAAAPGQDMLHIESVASRSRLYHWEIEPHVHQGLYQILWLQRGSAEVVLDEWRASVAGPAAIVVPPGVVHGFVFAPETDGRVLTLSARFLVEGEFQAVGEAFRALFSAPGVLHFSPDDGEVQRLSVQLGELAAEFNLPGSADAPVVQRLRAAGAIVLRNKDQRLGAAVAGIVGKLDCLGQANCGFLGLVGMAPSPNAKNPADWSGVRH